MVVLGRYQYDFLNMPVVTGGQEFLRTIANDVTLGNVRESYVRFQQVRLGLARWFGKVRLS